MARKLIVGTGTSAISDSQSGPARAQLDIAPERRLQSAAAGYRDVLPDKSGDPIPGRIQSGTVSRWAVDSNRGKCRLNPGAEASI
jgi:hypothetical protein